MRPFLFATAILACISRGTAAPFPGVWTVFIDADSTIALDTLTRIPRTLVGVDGKPVRGMRVTADSGMIDVQALVGGAPREGREAVLCAVIDLVAPMELTAGFAADWWMEVYCGGKPVLSTMETGNRTGWYSVLNWPVTLQLPRGRTLIAARVKSGSAGWCFVAGGSELIAAAREQEAHSAAREKDLLAGADSTIAAIRMGSITVRARPGATVSVRQLRHEFPFGTAISSGVADGRMDSATVTQYQQVLIENFNSAVHENALKWTGTERKGPDTPDYAVADAIVDWCVANDIALRGHCLFWEVENHVQPWIKELDEKELRHHVARRATDVVTRYRGRIGEYDINNEMIHGDFYTSRLGIEGVRIMARSARTADPAVALYVNDFGILNAKKLSRYMAHIRMLQDSGIVIDGIGCQGHFYEYGNITHVREALDTLATLGLPIKITEFDYADPDPDRQAQWLATFYRLCFGHPAVAEILMWGFWEGAHWRPDAALWKRDWTPTPAALAYRDLVFGQWWTDVAGQADEAGVFECRAFYGTHRVTVDGVGHDVVLRAQDGGVEVGL